MSYRTRKVQGGAKKPHFCDFSNFFMQDNFLGKTIFWVLIPCESGNREYPRKKLKKNQNIKGQHIFLMRAIDFPHKNYPESCFP